MSSNVTIGGEKMLPNEIIAAPPFQNVKRIDLIYWLLCYSIREIWKTQLLCFPQKNKYKTILL